MRLDHLLSMETGTDFHGSVIRVKTRAGAQKSGVWICCCSIFRDREGESLGSLKRKSPWYGGVAQLGEHLPCKQGVMGSNPIISTIPGNREHGKMGRINTTENGL